MTLLWPEAHIRCAAVPAGDGTGVDGDARCHRRQGRNTETDGLPAQRVPGKGVSTATFLGDYVGQVT